MSWSSREQGINRVVARVMGIGWHEPIQVHPNRRTDEEPDIRCPGCKVMFDRRATYNLTHGPDSGKENPDFFGVTPEGEPDAKAWRWHRRLVGLIEARGRSIFKSPFGSAIVSGPNKPAALARAVEDHVKYGGGF